MIARICWKPRSDHGDARHRAEDYSLSENRTGDRATVRRGEGEMVDGRGRSGGFSLIGNQIP
jgi:hypothetical protein